ncbi:MAG: response regulator transcription factor [Spirochaetaceae bacterium]
MKIRLVLADDHTIIRRGLRALIEETSPDMQVVAEASNGLEVLDIAGKQRVDVFVIDIAMPKLDGISTTARLTKENPQARVVILSMYKDETVIERVVHNGARAFVLKDSSPIEVINAIEAVYSGNYYFSPEISGQIVQSLIEGGRNNRGDEPDERLTERQQEILRLICDGQTEREIGDALNISHHTVHVHKNNIMNLLNLHSKVDLVKYAVKKRIIQL